MRQWLKNPTSFLDSLKFFSQFVNSYAYTSYHSCYWCNMQNTCNFMLVSTWQCFNFNIRLFQTIYALQQQCLFILAYTFFTFFNTNYSFWCSGTCTFAVFLSFRMGIYVLKNPKKNEIFNNRKRLGTSNKKVLRLSWLLWAMFSLLLPIFCAISWLPRSKYP